LEEVHDRTIDERFTKIETNLAEINAKLATIETRDESVATNLATINLRMQQADNRYDSMQKEFVDMKDEIVSTILV
jgi:hypothetical protein